MRALIATSMLAMSLTAAATGSDLDLHESVVMESATADVAALPYRANPAAMFTRFDSSRSTFNALGSYLGSDEPWVMQDGTGHLLGALRANSYMRLNPATVVWGGAEFSTGQRRNLRWTEAVDYDRIAPYVLGDSVGGDLSERRYSFYGGYAGRRGRWGWGAKAGYTASIDYRDRDPRDKIVVSDLDIDLGATCAVGGYDFGIGARLNVYNQDCDLEFYNPVNNIRVYVFTGLGTVYSRFSGNSAENTAYDGLGYRIALTLIPHAGNGAWGAVSYRQDYVKQVLRDFNNLTLTHADTYHFQGEAGWKGAVGILTLAPRAELKWRRRIGTENLFGSSVGTDYNCIGDHTYYYSDRVGATIKVPMSIATRAASSLELEPQVGYLYNHENYRTPARDLEADRLSGRIKASYMFNVGKVRLRPGIDGALSWGSGMNRRLTGLNPESAIGRMVNHNYDMLIADYRSLDVSVGASFNVTPAVALQFEGRVGCCWIDCHGRQSQAAVTAGVVF